MTRWLWWEGRWKPRIPGHIWTCRDGGRGNGHGHSCGGGRLSSLWFFVTNSLISQDLKIKRNKKESIHGSRHRHILSPRRSSFIVPNGGGAVLYASNHRVT